MRVKTTTTIDKELLHSARSLAKEKGLEGANAIIERALELYFSKSDSLEVWEKTLSSGWIKKLIIQGDSILFENIKYRKNITNSRPENYTEETLISRL